MWPFARRQWVFEPPPCNCAEIETYVQAACALRDEMAAWATPLEEWKRLQEMPILRPKGEQSSRDATFLVGTSPGTTKRVVPMYESYYPLPKKRFAGSVRLRLEPGESFEPGTILVRSTGRYRVTQRLFDNTNCVLAEWRG